MKKRVAIIAPSKTPETFIQGHIDGLRPYYDLVYFFGGFLPDRRIEEGKERRTGGILLRVFYLLSSLFTGEKDKGRERALERDLKRTGVSFVLAEYGQVGARVAPVCKALGIPLFVYFFGYDAHLNSVLRRYRKAYAFLFDTAKGLIGVSDSILERLKELGAPESKLHRIPSGVDLDEFHGADPSRNGKTALFIGRLVPKKAPLLLIEAFSKVLEEHPKARLEMIGDGPLLEQCKAKIRQKKAEDKIFLLGKLSHSELSEYYRKARVYVQHSVTASDGDSEGTPVSIQEAMAAGLPIVSTFHGGIPQIVKDNLNGFLVEEGNVEAMGRRIASLLADPYLAGQMGRKGREVAKKEFAQEKIGEKLKKLFEESSSLGFSDKPEP